MTEYELIDSYHSAVASWLGTVSLFVSILFAYLVTAFLVGRRLTRSQLVTASGLYTLMSAFCLLALYQTNVRMVQFAREILAINPERSFLLGTVESPSRASIVPVGILLIAFAGGIIFMVQERRGLAKDT
jgi:hypothetical protein